MITPGWPTRFAQALASAKPIPYLGVVGPVDKTNSGLLTHNCVHRRHYEAFGLHAPYVFGNYYSDDWIQQVRCATLSLNWVCRSTESAACCSTSATCSSSTRPSPRATMSWARPRPSACS